MRLSATRAVPAARRERGVSLLESMIAIVLVALGILAILGVQLRTLTDTQTAVRRSQAIRLVEDLSERLRINPSSLTEAVLQEYEVGWGAAEGTPPNCGSGCTAAQWALRDILEWKDVVAATLPLGDAAVFRVADASAPGNVPQLGVMISWRENERADADIAYLAPFAVGNTGTGGVDCPQDRICHLQYLQPTQRCTPDVAADAANPVMVCP